MKNSKSEIDKHTFDINCPHLTFPLPHELVHEISKFGKPGLRRSLVWFRNDLRVTDHAPLIDACLYSNAPEESSEHERSCVIGLYIYNAFDFNVHDWGVPKLDFLHRNLVSLSESLWNLYKIPLLVIRIDTSDLSYAYFQDLSIGVYSPPYKRAKCDQDLPASLRRAKLAEELYNFCKVFQISRVYGHFEISPDEALRDEAIITRFNHEDNEARISCHFDYNDQSLLPFGSVCTKSTNEPYRVFTKFRTLWATTLLSLAKASKSISENSCASFHKRPLPWAMLDQKMYPNSSNDQLIQLLRSSSVKSIKFLSQVSLIKSINASEWPEGEEVCISNISLWISQHLSDYRIQRDIPANENGTSKISPYLALGVISIRTLTRILFETSNHGPISLLAGLSSKGTINRDVAGATTYLSELCWREFYRNILFSFPKVGKGHPFQEATKSIPWRDSDTDPVAASEWRAWCSGQTGFPIVDAAMRQLLSMGWMHNRCRMIVASFLVKDLLIDWRKGEQFFIRHLVDADLASNNGGWQWSASTGTDSQPYFRIFHPISQGQRWDPNGDYIKRWVPELSNLLAPCIHNPTEHMSVDDFAKIGYPKPIVDHSHARLRTLDVFKTALARAKRNP